MQDQMTLRSSESGIQKQSPGAFSLRATSLDEAMRFADIMAQSTIVPQGYRNKPGDILVAVQMGADLGLPPMQSLQNIANINGRPSVYGDAAKALCEASSVCEYIEESISDDGSVATCKAKRRGRPNPVVSTFSEDDAKAAKLWGKQGPWTQYPRRMLQMRARGFALRDAFPDVLKGLITYEEARDYPAEAIDMGEAKVVTSARVVEAPPPIERTPPGPPDAETLPPDEPPPLFSIGEIMGEIESAQSLADLLPIVDKAKGLNEQERGEARAAWSARKKEIDLKTAEAVF